MLEVVQCQPEVLLDQQNRGGGGGFDTLTSSATVSVEGAKPGAGDTLTSSAGAVEGVKPGEGDTLASFSAAVEGAKPKPGGGGGVCALAHQQAVRCGIPCSLNVCHQHLWVCPSSAYVNKT
jgi:hypothetical protein